MLDTQKYYQMNNIACQYFLSNLDKRVASNARKYLENRQLSNNVIKQWGLGHAGRGDGLAYQLIRSGFSLEEIEEAGLGRKANGKMRDAFFDRIMFPIINENNNIIGFGGRALNNEIKPKYLNTKTTEKFKKSRELYGLTENTLGRIKARSQMIICEGYMDVIAMHEAGVDNCVATLGTALTEDHLEKIKTLGINEVIYMFDGDDAGCRAACRTLKYIDKMLGEGMPKFMCVMLKDGEDPDSYIRGGGNIFDYIKTNKKDLVNGCVEYLFLNCEHNGPDFMRGVAGVHECLKAFSGIDTLSQDKQNLIFSAIAEVSGKFNADMIKQEWVRKFGENKTNTFTYEDKLQRLQSIESEPILFTAEKSSLSTWTDKDGIFYKLKLPIDFMIDDINAGGYTIDLSDCNISDYQPNVDDPLWMQRPEYIDKHIFIALNQERNIAIENTFNVGGNQKQSKYFMKGKDIGKEMQRLDGYGGIEYDPVTNNKYINNPEILTYEKKL